MSRTTTAEKDPRDRLREARQALYREHILDAAEVVFAELGYEEAKVQTVAQSARVSLTTLYGVFPTKWDLYRAVHARRISALLGHALSRGRADGPTDPVALLLMGIASYIEFHVAHPEYLKMHLREGNTWSQPSTLRCPEQLDAWQFGLRMMSATFKAGIEQGLFVEDSPEVMARTAIAMHQVRLADWVERGMREDAERLVRLVRAQFIRTFCAPEHVPALLAEHCPPERRGARQRMRRS
jgi:AcrR family transcriptional regulator